MPDPHGRVDLRGAGSATAIRVAADVDVDDADIDRTVAAIAALAEST